MISTRAAWQLQNIAQQPTKFSMADSDSQDAAARDRIISHMNKDHHDSVRTSISQPTFNHETDAT